MAGDSQIIEIDASLGDGGGQTVRTALSLAAILKKSCRIFNIREKRPNPGLALAHVCAINALAKLSQAEVSGNSVGSRELTFIPGEINDADLVVKIETPASMMLVAQVLTPVLISAKKPLAITFTGGATDAKSAPTLDHFRYCFLAVLEKMARRSFMEFIISQRGYYPEGGGKLTINCQPFANKELNPLDLAARGGLKRVRIISGASDSFEEKKVAEMQVSGVMQVLGKLKLPLERSVEYRPSPTPGSHILILAEFENGILGIDALGTHGKNAQAVGEQAALELLKQERSGACVDKYTADQILLYLALAIGASRIRVPEITSHCQTNMRVVENFIPRKFTVEGNLISLPAR